MKLTMKFRRALHSGAVVTSIEQYRDLLHQADLFDGDRLRTQWLNTVPGTSLERRDTRTDPETMSAGSRRSGVGTA
jgi:hypothetical protein